MPDVKPAAAAAAGAKAAAGDSPSPAAAPPAPAPAAANGNGTPQKPPPVPAAAFDMPKPNLRGLNKPKCIQCGNAARSRCPFQCCKACCYKAQNPCHIHASMGMKDTLYAENRQQFNLESNISGTVDFIFGNVRTVFQKCRLQVRLPMEGKHNVIIAQGRNNATSLESGFAFHECVAEAAPVDDLNGVDTFLGRPYKNFSHVVFIKSFLGGVVNATDWVPWNKDHEVEETMRTVEYREYGNIGQGGDTA
ncbi:putative pectinesterase/pectinesterase inhibitor 24 [Dichanthelium oligosanthes]|uniref:Pectinesterase n=1 Tax=Dichanthelium oligosanthes TaxID=888268 RepID=A0A1E5W4A7_9POAL|nr:putative pectinesterase/pectinesterase inhibitor 24 [Dichanthelium oligosanthes]